MNENDLRVQRTRRLLQQALIKLANDTDYDQITIRDITYTAQVGYKTFFRHYESKEALLAAIVKQSLATFQAVALAPNEPNSIKQNTLIALRLAKENSKTYRAILNSPTAAQLLLEPMKGMAYNDSQQFLGKTSIPRTLIGHHFAASMLNLLTWWLDHDNEYSTEEMLDFIEQLLIQPIEQLHTE